jgi:DNA-binding transcriptional MerR regulator
VKYSVVLTSGMNKKPTYSISDLTKHFDLTPRTIRFYESEGLLSPKRESGKRIYRERDLVRLKLILRGKRLGFSLGEIKTTMELYDTQPNETAQLNYVLAIIETHKQELFQKQQDIENTLEEMDAVAENLQQKLGTFTSSG